MSPLELTALGAVAAWLAVLTFMAVLVLRQVTLLTVGAGGSRGPIDINSFENGLMVGTALSDGARDALPDRGTGLGYVVFLSGSCQPCRTFAVGAGQDQAMDEYRDSFTVTAAVTGLGPQVDEMVRLLPPWFTVFQGDRADMLSTEFDVAATPAIYEIEGGSVTGKATPTGGIGDFLNLIRARSGSNAAQFAGVATTSKPFEMVEVDNGKT